MTPGEMDRAIAEHLGWEFIPCRDDGFGRATGESWRDPDGDIGPFPPDYSTDLDAMHEAEKTLTDEDFEQHYGPFLGAAAHARSRRALICATAAQRAEAFVRTIGKWRDA